MVIKFSIKISLSLWEGLYSHRMNEYIGKEESSKSRILVSINVFNIPFPRKELRQIMNGNVLIRPKTKERRKHRNEIKLKTSQIFLKICEDS